MPNRDMDGVTVVVFRSSKWNPETMCIHEAYRAITLLFEYLLLDEEVQLHGIKFICDTKNISWKHLNVVPPKIKQKWSAAVSKAYPIRIRGIIYVNFPDWAMIMLKVFKKLLPKKIVSRMTFIGQSKAKQTKQLQSILPNDCLPESYGGTVSEENQIHWQRDLDRKTEKLQAPYSYLRSYLSSDEDEEDVDIASKLTTSESKDPDVTVITGTSNDLSAQAGCSVADDKSTDKPTTENILTDL